MRFNIVVEFGDNMSKLLKKSHEEIIRDALQIGFDQLTEKCVDEALILAQQGSMEVESES
jgi:hypothetical protein